VVLPKNLVPFQKMEYVVRADSEIGLEISTVPVTEKESVDTVIFASSQNAPESLMVNEGSARLVNPAPLTVNIVE
jgi:hypothetical protein